jgi:calcium-binding protein CML
MDIADYKGTALSSAQAAQIREIFDLFDTDDTGYIDKREIQFALSALGFQTQGEGKSKEETEALDAIMGDGKVTLEEFSALMTGEIGGHNPYEEARSAFALLSRPDGDRSYDGLITLSKLEAVCLEYQVVYCI